MPRIEGSAIDVVDNATIWRHLFHLTADIVLDKVSLYLLYPTRNGIVTTAVANGFVHLLSGINHNHRHSDTAEMTCRFEYRFHFPHTRSVFQTEFRNLTCSSCCFLIPGFFSIGYTANDGECLRKEVATHPYGIPRLVYMEIHFAILVETFVAQKLIAQARTIQPFLTRFNGIV